MTAPLPPDSLPPATVQPANLLPEPPAQVPVVRGPGPLDRNPAAVYLNGKPSVAGRRGLERSLNRAAEILTGGLSKDALTVNWAEVRYQHVEAMRAKLIDDPDISTGTINHTLAAVRGTLRAAWKLGYIDADTRAMACDVGNVKETKLPAGRHVSLGEIRRLFEVCGDTPVGARDAAMLALLYGCGVRRGEAVAIELADYAAGRVTVRHGKGRKERIVYCPTGGRRAIDAWIARRGPWPGTLLCPVKKGGLVEQRPMTAQAVLMRLRFLANLAHVPQFSPHDLRRSFVGELLDSGADISSVQQLAGHADVGTTQRYDRRPEEAKRKAAELLHVPYDGPSLLVGGDPDPAGEPG